MVTRITGKGKRRQFKYNFKSRQNQKIDWTNDEILRDVKFVDLIKATLMLLNIILHHKSNQIRLRYSLLESKIIFVFLK